MTADERSIGTYTMMSVDLSVVGVGDCRGAVLLLKL